MTPELDRAMDRLNGVLAHAWMVRTFLKHSEEIQDDEDMLSVHRMIFDYVRALEGSYQRRDHRDYFRRAQGKFSKLRKVAELLTREQPRVSSHTNFQMAALSLSECVREIEAILQSVRPLLYPSANEPQETTDDDSSASEPNP